jgi:phosphoenolpyruvate phosphomutase
MHLGPDSNGSRSRRLRALLDPSELSFILEAHDGLSARIAEEAGFPAIWASGLAISSALGVRDNNEASWTQVLEVAEFMADATRLPILLDGDTGFGNFNIFRRVVRKLEQRGIAGVCIEDKVFPKTNSFLRGSAQPLADVDEFCGKLKAGRDAQQDRDFVLVARTEALIAGWGLAEALRRADAYRQAGADAIVVHSAQSRPDEILAFLQEWAGRHPVILIPTKYYMTPTEVFAQQRVSALIWANHLLRSSLSAMQATAARIARDRSVMGVEEGIAPLAEVFRLQGDDELRVAENRYLSASAGDAQAIVLAATRGSGPLEPLTEEIPKTLLPVGGVTLLDRLCRNLGAIGVRRVAVVAGYRAEKIARPGLEVVVNAAWAATGEVASLACARERLDGPCLVVFGDVFCRRHHLQRLLLDDGDVVIAVDRRIRSDGAGRQPRDVVRTRSLEHAPMLADEGELVAAAHSADLAHFDGEWIGLMKLSPRGAAWVRELMDATPAAALRSLQLVDVLQALVTAGRPVRVQYVAGDWLTVESLVDLTRAANL